MKQNTHRIPTHKAVSKLDMEWVYGTHYYDNSSGEDYILYGSVFDGLTYEAVISETVSEYTGRLLDGEPIYENDLLLWQSVDDIAGGHHVMRVPYSISKVCGEFYAISQDSRKDKEPLSFFLDIKRSYESIFRLSNLCDVFVRDGSLSKGMSISSNSWVYGSVTPPDEDNIVCIIDVFSGEDIPVYRSSICKSTSKKDQSGDYIFQRDIISYTLGQDGPEGEGVVFLNNGMAIVQEGLPYGDRYRYFEDQQMQNIKIKGSLVGSTLSSN